MTRRRLVVVVALASLIGSALFSALPAGASHPGTLDPALLRLPSSGLPAGSVVDHDAVSDNADADGAPSPDGHPARTYQLHHQLYDVLGRITGYRMDFHFNDGGVEIEGGYLASIFATPDAAKAAMNDAVGQDSIIAYVGHKLPDACTAGDACQAYYGPNPNEPGKTGMIVIFTRGPILMEVAAQVPNDSFNQLETSMEASLFGLAATLDALAQQALGAPSTGGSSTPTPTATATSIPVPPPAAPTKTATKTSKKHCKKGYKLKHGKCKKVRKP
jgi:cell division septation protein DedD